MSDYTDYAERLSERYSSLAGTGTSATMEDAYQPLYADRGPLYAVKELSRAQKAIEDARRRARSEQIEAALNSWAHLDLLVTAPVGRTVPISKVLNNDTRVVLRGKPGSGKSTALRYLVTHPLSTQDGDLLTLMVDLGALAASEQTLSDFLSADAKAQMGLDLSPDFFRNVLWTGQAVVCLDGLDQIQGQEGRAAVVQQIESWIEDYPRCRYIVTARSGAYEPKLDSAVFAHYGLVPWNDAVVEVLQSEWDQAAAEWTDKEKLAQLGTAPRIVRDIVAARTLMEPLQEGDVDGVWSGIADRLWDLPWQERIILVYRFLSQEDPEVWSQLMTRLLDAEMSAPRFVVRRQLLLGAFALEASESVADLDPEVRARIVDELVNWIRDGQAPARKAAVEAMYGLSKEPLVAEAVLGIVADPDVDAWSREAAVLLLGRLALDDLGSVTNVLVERVDNGDENLMVRQAAGTALGHLASRLEKDDQVRQEILDELLERIRDNELLISVRGALTEALGGAIHLGESYVDEMVALAEGKGEASIANTIQVAAGRALANLTAATGDSELLARVWELAEDPEVNEYVRIELYGALGTLDDAQRAATSLLALAQDEDVYPPGHRAALETLGDLGYSDEQVVAVLITIAETKDRKTKDFERLAAALALGELNHLDLSLQYILTLIADKSIYRSTRNEALAVLGQKGLSGDEDLDNAMVAVLQIWVTEENTTEDVRERAMKSLEMLGVVRDDIVRDLVGVVQDKQTYPRVRRAAVGTLARLSLTDEQKAMVVESISAPFYDQEEKSDLLRVPTARLLYLWGEDEHGLEYLRLAAEKSYMALVRYRAGLVLQELGENELARETLLKLATDTSIADPIRCGSMRALSLWHVGDEELAEEFVPVAQEEECMPTVPEAAYDAIRSLLMA